MESKQEERKMRTVVVTAIGSFSADMVVKKCRENEIAENEILCILFQIEKKKTIINIV